MQQSREAIEKMEAMAREVLGGGNVATVEEDRARAVHAISKLENTLATLPSDDPVRIVGSLATHVNRRLLDLLMDAAR